MGGDLLWKCVEESHRSEGVYLSDLVISCKEGRWLSLRFGSAPILDEAGRIMHRVATVEDRTEQADLEESSRRNEKLASIGLLAAGIAHEINNPTGAALLAAETALTIKDLPEAREQLEICLRNIVTSMDRCGRIVRTLLRYSRQETSEKQACSVNDVVEQALDLARPYGESHGAELHMDLDAEVPLVPMNPLEIELVLVNLIRNAIEAGGGSVAVCIATRKTETGVSVQVSDNGCGMNQEQLEHVFDPLYTTRRQAGGTGLGMSIAYGIVQGHQGSMDVESQQFKGTTVTIELPIGAGSIGQESFNRKMNHGSNTDCRR